MYVFFFAWVCSCCSFFNSPANQGSRSGQEAIHENCKNQLMIHYSPVDYMKWYPCSIIQYPIIRITCLIMFQYQTPQTQIILQIRKRHESTHKSANQVTVSHHLQLLAPFWPCLKHQGNRPSWRITSNQQRIWLPRCRKFEVQGLRPHRVETDENWKLS